MNVLDHLHSRYLDTSLHRVWVDEDVKVATFPLWNLSGQLVGYQQYRPGASKERKNDPRNGRYFTRLKDAKIGVWGLESYHLSNTLFITEGIFDAARISYFGYAAVATLSNDLATPTARWLQSIRSYKHIVAICDSDAAGRKLAKHGDSYHIVQDYKDLGDASEDYIKNLLSNYSQ